MEIILTEIDHESVHVKCEDEKIDQRFLIEDLPGLVKLLGNYTYKFSKIEDGE